MVFFSSLVYYGNFLVGEEDISNLSPTLLLFKASAAHNIPVMCHAMALKADKTWVDPEGKLGHLHQAVTSVGILGK